MPRRADTATTAAGKDDAPGEPAAPPPDASVNTSLATLIAEVASLREQLATVTARLGSGP